MFADAQPTPALAAVGAGEDLARSAGEHGAAAIGNDRRIVDVGIVEPTCDARPAFAAVAAAPYAINLDASPDNTMIRRIDGQRRHPRNPDVRAFFGHVGPQLLPMPPAIGSSVERRR